MPARLATTPAPLHIGSVVIDPPLVQAPMAGFTNLAYRRIVRDYGGAGLQYTEMVNAKGTAWLDRQGRLPDRLWGVGDEPRPIGIQIWDNDPATLAAVGQRMIAELDVSVIDINFGCPVRQVTEKAQSGSYLLQDPRRIGEIVARVVRACAPVPVTAKIRLGRTQHQITAVDVARAVEQAGGAALTVHGRTADQFFRGRADWDQIAAIADHLDNIPLIGNGDVTSADQAVDLFRQYPINGLMIGRAALGRPWLFQQIHAGLQGRPIPPDPTADEQRMCLCHHYDLIVERFGAEKGTMLMRKYACCYAQGKRGARAFRAAVARVATPDQFRTVVRTLFPTSEIDAAAD